MKPSDRIGMLFTGFIEFQPRAVRMRCLLPPAAVWFCAIHLLVICASADTATPVVSDAAKPLPTITTTATAVAVSAVLVSAPTVSAKNQDQELWEQLRQAEMTGKSDTLADWAVINGMPLAPKVKGIDAEFSAIASVLMMVDPAQPPNYITCDRYYNRVKLFLRDYTDALNVYIRIKFGRISSVATKSVVESYFENCEERKKFPFEAEANKREEAIGNDWDELDVALQKSLSPRPPPYLCATRGHVLVNYLKKLDANPSIAVQKYWIRNWHQCRELCTPVDISHGRLLLDNGIPFVIKDSDHVWVCFGYVVNKKGTSGFWVADSNKVGFVKKVQTGPRSGQNRLDALGSLFAKGGVELFDDGIFVDALELSPYCSFLPWPCMGKMVVISQPSMSISEINKWVK